jgi:uncharacterized protein
MKKLLIVTGCILLGYGAYSLDPSRTYSARPGDYGLNYEEVSFPTDDKLNLKGWLYKPATVSYKMIILSDDGHGNMADFIELASYFVTLGYNVLTYDYRGYGESDDFDINTNFYIYAHFEKDLQAAINYVRKYHSKMKVVNLYGKGIGAALSITIGASRKEISQVIADSPYSKLEDMKKRIKEKRGVDVLLPLGYDKYILEPYFAMESKTQTLEGILLIAGEADDLVTPADLRELSKLQRKLATVFTVKGVKSEDTFTTDKNNYFEQIRAFLK